MGSVATTTFSNPLQYPSQTHIDRDKSTGYLYVLVHATAANTYDVYRSINNGSSWSLFLSDTRSSITDQGSIFISPDGYLRWVYRTNESSQDRIYIRGLLLDSGSPSWENELLLANPSNGGSAGSYHTGLDVWATITSSKEYYCIAVGTTIGANSGVTLYGAYTPSRPGLTVASNSIIRGTRQWLFSGTGRITPSIDAQHSGDAKTASTPDLWVSFGRTGLYVSKLSWQGDGWQGPSTPVTLATGLAARDHVPARWDGAQHLTLDWTGSTPRLYERNKANTLTSIRTGPSHPQGTIRSAALSYDKVTRDARVIAVGTTNADPYYVNYTRATDSWTSYTLLTADDVPVGTNPDSFGVRRSTHGNNKFDMISARSTGPQIQHFTGGVSYAPNTPFWSFVGLPYVNGGAADVTASLLLDWVFDDPDDTDTQSAYALSRQINGGALNYFRASDTTWQVAEVKNVSGTSLLNLASGWAADGDLVTYKAKTWDSADIPSSSYSAALNLYASTPVNPTITAPGATVVEDHVTVTWTVSEQKAYRVELLIFGFLLEDSGWIENAATRTYQLTTRLENAFSYTARLTTKNNEGLASTPQTANFTVAFAVPQLPTAVITPNSTTGNINVTITNPARALIGVGTVSHNVNASVTPGLPAGLLPDSDGSLQQLMVCIAAIRNSGTGTVNLPAGWTDLANFGNMRVFGRTYVTGDAAPTVTFTGGAASEDTSARIVAWRGAQPTLLGTAATQLNGVVQDVATPALTVTQQYALVLMVGWKQDDATGGAFPGTFTEVVDDSTTTGNDQSIYMGYQFQSSPAANISTSTITITGGATAISRGIVLAVSSAPDVNYVDVYRREAGLFVNGTRVGANVAANGTLADFRAKSGVAYEYRLIAFGTTGTSRLGVFAP